MTTLSREDARAILDDIRVVNGGVREESQRLLPEDDRRAIRNLQSMLGHSIVHVADDLYDEDTRFIFELIQNAEDTHYHLLAGQEEVPFIHFTLLKDRITIDTNEDGFTENDVRAICSIHNSSKQQVGGYIGHKGIGFKSVFKIAHRVHIQSGPFSFSFRHQRGESGLGMITPFNEDHEELPEGVRTRLTLNLIRPEDFETRARELKEIPDTLLLFLRKLRRINIDIPTLESHRSFERRETPSSRTISLVKEVDGVREGKIYHVQKKVLRDLPRHDSRPGQNTAEVVLAFPVDESSLPIIEPQYIYSFLPMRHEGFTFLIQSDFITQANRQGVHHCPRNDAIRQGISELFADAVRFFCTTSPLKYEWLQFLPGLSIYDPFWAALREMIFEELRRSKILLSRGEILDYPNKLQHPSARHCDRHGQPLLDDIKPEIYLSGSYDWSKHADSLTELGVTNLSFDSILDRLDPYLKSSLSRLRPRFLNPDLDDDWHTRVATHLLRGLNGYKNVSRIVGRLKSMALIPTFQGQLVSALNTVYFPDDRNGNPIPDDLPLMVVDGGILQNTARLKLIEALGVERCMPTVVIQYILQKYNSPCGVTLKNSISHLKYLFKSLGPTDELDKRIFIMDQMERPVYRSLVTFGVPIIKDDLYFATDGEYGTKLLSEKLRSGNPTFEIHIIHDAYIEAVSQNERSHGRSWMWWLETMASVRNVPRLTVLKNFNRGSLSGSSLNEELSILCQHMVDHDPMTLLGVLKTHWDSVKSGINPPSTATLALRAMRVPSQNRMVPRVLSSSYFPSREILDLCRQAAVKAITYVVLDLPNNLVTDDTNGWEFLATFGVKMKPDIIFFKCILFAMKQAFPLPVTQSMTQTVEGCFKMYEELAIRFRGDAKGLKEIIFDKIAAVCLPLGVDSRPEMIKLSQCVWKGEPCLRTKRPLAIYSEYTGNGHVSHLFQHLLKLPDADVGTYLEELKSRKENPDISTADITEIYNIISRSTQNSIERAFIINEFTHHSLVYLPSVKRWVPPGSCVWAQPSKIGGQYGISAIYPTLEALFNQTLNIQVPTAATYIEQLKLLESENPVNINEIKSTIYKLKSLYLTSDDLDNLCRIRFLPVRRPDNNVTVLRSTDTFFIADTIEYQSTFAGKAALLDFSLEESRRLERFLASLGLEGRYISRIVKEKTVVKQPASEHSPRETRNFLAKAKHLYRCALHFNTELLEGDSSNLRQQLRGAVVIESDGFENTLELQLNDFTVTVRKDNGLVHIEHTDESLRVYVPRNPQDRQQCYSLHLPRTLTHFLNLRDNAAYLMLQVVFTSSQDMLDLVLDNNGIIQADTADFPDLEPELNENALPGRLSIGRSLSPVTVSETNETDNLGIDTPRSSTETAHDLSSDADSTDFEELPQLQWASPQPERVTAAITHQQAGLRLPRPFTFRRPSFTFPEGVTEAAPPVPQYVQLLGNVIRLARAATLPAAGQIPINGLPGGANLTIGQPFGVRSNSQLAHDIKIGAAGELYVFELLQRLNLPGFNRDNWRSTIRKEVIVHPDYQDLPLWRGVETADLVYHDTTSTLTSLLINGGYLPQETWQGADPNYYIEVKTTTGECDSAFFMSKAQYRRMQRMRLGGEGQQRNEVYIICRVYHLNRESIGLRIYVDPESLREEGRLVFTAESYSIVPGQV